MTMLVPVPIVSQRDQTGHDGYPPEDGNMDCVPASLSAMAQALLGISQNADQWHDDVYGQGYIGLQDPARYQIYAAAKGLRLTYSEAGAAGDVAAAVAALQEHKPVLLAIPSDWLDNPPHSSSVHMVAGCDTDGGTVLTCMNPWTAAYEHYTLEWWRELLTTCAYHGIWTMERVAPVANNWTNDGAPNGVPTAHDTEGTTVHYGFAAYVVAHPDTPNAVRSDPEGYVGGGDDFLPLADGGALWYSKATNSVNRLTGDLGRMVRLLLDSYRAAQDAPPPPAPVPSDPQAEALAAAVVALVKARGA